MSERLPFELGRFRLTDRLGSGSMGVVYRGLDPLIGREVAVKVIRTEVLDDADRGTFRERFLREARSVGRCIHPGIVTIYDVGEQGGDPFIVMAYIEGETLQRRLSSGRLPVDECIDITLQLLSAIGHAHERGVIHRDIKPANVIMSAQRAIVTDFGIARLNAAGHTLPGLLLGTPNYMAPEQARGEPSDHRADLFAVGMVFLRMLTGSLPFQEDSVAAVLHRVASTTPVDLEALEAIDQRLASVAALALAKDPADRFQTAEEFAHMLQAMTVARQNDDMWLAPPAEAPPVILPAEPARPLAPSLAAAPPVVEPAAEWPPGLAEEVTAALAKIMGPIARVLVARTRRSAPSLEAFMPSLLQSLPDGSPLEACEQALSPILARHRPEPEPEESVPEEVEMAEPVVIAVDGPANGLTPAVLSSAQTMLSRFIGPIARILVRRTSLEAGSIEHFGEQLATYLDHEDERNAFKREFDRDVIGEKTRDRR